MFKIKNLFFLIVFIFGCDPSSNSHKKDIDLIVQINNKFLSKSTDFNLIIKDAIVQ